MCCQDLGGNFVENSESGGKLTGTLQERSDFRQSLAHVRSFRLIFGKSLNKKQNRMSYLFRNFERALAHHKPAQQHTDIQPGLLYRPDMTKHTRPYSLGGLIGKPTVGKPFFGLEGLAGLDFEAVLRTPVAAGRACEHLRQPPKTCENRRKPASIGENLRKSAILVKMLAFQLLAFRSAVPTDNMHMYLACPENDHSAVHRFKG